MVAEPSVVDEEAISLDLEDLAGEDLSARLGERSAKEKGKNSGLELEDLASLLEDNDAGGEGPPPRGKKTKGGDAPLDLEDLDLELELEDPEGKGS